MRQTLATLLITLVAAGTSISTVRARGQRPPDVAPESSRSFEVASVKESKNVGQGGMIMPTSTPGRVIITNIPLHDVVQYAYGMREDQVFETPDWTRSTRFNITATYLGDRATEAQAQAMLQILLADRFSLAAHRETRELPTYSLVLARADGRLGPRLLRSEGIDCAQWFAEKRPQIGAGGPSPVAPGGQRPQCMLMGGSRFLTGGTQSIAKLVMSLQGIVRAPVIDETGLSGTFNIDVEWTPNSELETPSGATVPSAGDGVSFFTALQEQLGLKLEPRRAPVEVLVIDHVERPTED